MAVQQLGHSATSSGWRKKLADAVAPRVGESSLPLRERQVRTLLGLLLLASSIKYVVKTVRGAAS